MQPYYSAAEIADHLQALIEQGHHRPGDRLPFADLQRTYDCPPSRLQRAMWLLRERGMVERRPGLGHFVIEGRR